MYFTFCSYLFFKLIKPLIVLTRFAAGTYTTFFSLRYVEIAFIQNSSWGDVSDIPRFSGWCTGVHLPFCPAYKIA
jgi:hypothetical protein